MVLPIYLQQTYFKYKYAILRSEVDYYLRVEQYEISKQKGYELINLSEINNDTIEYTAALHNLGINFYKESDIETADSLISRAYEMNKLINYEPYIKSNLSMLANIASAQKNYTKAIEYNLIKIVLKVLVYGSLSIVLYLLLLLSVRNDYSGETVLIQGFYLN